MVAALAAAGCGGGSGGETAGTPDAHALASLKPSETYAAHCALPRPPGLIDPDTGRPYPDRAGTLEHEKRWVRSWIDETYLWYREVPKLSASLYAEPVAYFDDLKTPKTTASGKPKDQFHFSYATEEWVAMAQSGEAVGYGMQVALLAAYPPRQAVVLYTDPGTPAARQHIGRGARILSVDGVDLANGEDIDTLNAGLFPSRTGETHRFVLRDRDGARRAVKLKAAAVTSRPVLDVRVLDGGAGTKLGYLLFNDHIAPAEVQLMDAVRTLRERGPIDDLVLDLRYNGGGYLDIASELAYMIAGAQRSAGKVFEQAVFNGKNPFDLSRDETRTRFLSTTQGYSVPKGSPLPTLDLKRVYVLSGPGTCSASEALINGLRGIDVEVVQIGDTTCGKPYGFFPTDNCGTTYFAIQFAGRNAKGYGAYADGFVPGCRVADDFDHALGSRKERLLAAALNHRRTGRCSSGGTPHALAAPLVLLRSPLRENRYIR